MSLSDHFIKSLYAKETDDVLVSFYEPCVKASKVYKRISGYFSSTIFDLASDSFIEFFSKGGKMHLVCSPRLTPYDAEALINQNKKYTNDKDLLINLLADKNYKDTAQILCYLISNEFLEIKLAVGEEDELMHEKLGIFDDGQEQVSFIGSINETRNGWGEGGNLESFNTFISWSERDKPRVIEHLQRFNFYWDGLISGIRVLEPSSDFFKIAKENSKKGEVVLKLRKEQILKRKFKYIPNEYQKEVLINWDKNHRKGIVKFCTGAGKTVVGLLSIKWASEKNISTLLIVPSKTLMYQWEEEIKSAFFVSKTLLVGDNNNSWKGRSILEGYLRGSSKHEPNVVIAIDDTASSEEFIARASKIKNCLILADEVHNLGAKRKASLLNLNFPYRLGLSATPERFSDVEGTNLIFDYFDGVLDPIIDIPKAIELGRLVPYQYDFSIATLNEEEQDKWDKLTKQIQRQSAIEGGQKELYSSSNSKLQMMIINRSRIAKKALSKIQLSLDVFDIHYREGQRWLFFLEDGDQLEQFREQLQERDIKPLIYDGAKSMEERELITESIKQRGGVILSMKCLDEGVDIPSISHSVILASSQNPRQFVQRRGRVLRFAGKNKPRAYIWDIITMPSPESVDNTMALVVAEIARAIEFATYAENASVVTRLQASLASFGLTLEECIKAENENGEIEEHVEVEYE